jgi:L-methionine (R)-S-oxide reductase
MMEQNTVNELILETKNILGQEGRPDEKLIKIVSVLKDQVWHYDWVGFYILDKATNTLVLGPYVGAHTDHTQIPVGKGVCGQVAQNKETMIVQDVSKMENYLSCSIDVQSEIVAPVLLNGEFVAELDIDSHSAAPFTPNDRKLLEEICTLVAPLFNE